MKNRIVNTILVVLWIIVGLYIAGRETALHLYPATMYIDSIENDTVSMSTESGFSYAYVGASDEEVGEIMSVLMFDSFTPNITDDRIVEVRYSGF